MPTPEEAQHCVMVAAPHTSNWDFLWTLSAFRVLDIPIRFTIKQEWMRGPVGWIIRRLGGLSINRSQDANDPKRVSYTDSMAEILRSTDRIAMVVTPEGTRKARKEWKLGFYFAAQRANTHVCVGYCDYKTKHIGVAYCFLPSEHSIDADLRRMMSTYASINGKNPEGFATDHRYS